MEKSILLFRKKVLPAFELEFYISKLFKIFFTVFLPGERK